MAYELQSRSTWKWGNMTFRDVTYGPDEGKSLWQTCPLALLNDPSVGFVFFDDFYVFDATNNPHWVIAEDAGAGGTDAVQDTKNGWYRHYCDGDDNDGATIATAFENFGLTAGKGLWFEARVKLTESATNKANFAIGLSEDVTVDVMQDNAAGPIASNDHIMWFKEDSNMNLSFETSLAAAQTTRANVLAHVTAHVYRLGFYCKPASATTFTVYPYYYDETAAPAGGAVLSTALACTLTLTGWGPTQAFFAVKAGSDAEEYIEIDYMKIVMAR